VHHRLDNKITDAAVVDDDDDDNNNNNNNNAHVHALAHSVV